MTLPLPTLPLADRFRELAPIELWSAELKLTAGYDEFSEVVAYLAAEDGQRYTGFIERDDHMVRSFTRTRYPRQKYGVASVAACRSGMVTLAGMLDGTLLPERQTAGFRVVLGLIEGYDPNSPEHSLEEVQAKLPGVNVSSADVFALRHTDDGVSIYSEPVAIIRAPLTELPKTYELAEAFKQERFSVENFDLGLTRMVETHYCTEPD